MSGHEHRLPLFLLFLMLLALIASCAPVSPDFQDQGTSQAESEDAPLDIPVVVILPPEEESGGVRISEAGVYPVATGTICSTLMDTMLEETHRVLERWDFWTFHVNFRPAPAELTSIYPDATFAGCFRLYGRDDLDGLDTYYPFEEYLLTPCYSVNGDIALDTPRLVESTGTLTTTAPYTRTMHQVLVGSALFDGSAYIRCDFNLVALEAQYFAMYEVNDLILPERFVIDGEAGAKFAEVIASNGSGNQFVDYDYFAMSAAIPEFQGDFSLADDEWTTYDSFGGYDSGLNPPVSHPAIFMMPKCTDADYGALIDQLSDWRDAHLEDTPPSDPYMEWSSMLNDMVRYEECKGSTQLGATTLPASAASAPFPDRRIAISASLLGQTWLPDFTTWAPNGCREAGPCGFEAPSGGGQPTYLWLQYGALNKVNDTDPCLTPQGASPAAWAVDDGVIPSVTYDFYLNQKYLTPGTYQWRNWCSPTLSPSVLGHAQMELPFWPGNTDIYIGFNPITGEQFVGSMDEIWIDPDHSIGT